MGQIRIRNGYAVTMNERRETYPAGDVLAEDDRLAAVGEADSKPERTMERKGTSR